MKKVLFLIGGLISSMVINAQIINYTEAAILFSGEDINGTARFNAMGGAFGALGGDISAGDVNPAGLAVFQNTSFSGSLNLRNTDLTSTFAGENVLNNNSYFNLNQIGGVLVFNTGDYSTFKKIAIGFNYSIGKDFENSWFAAGQSIDGSDQPIVPLTTIYDPDILYPNANEQNFENFTDGRNDKFVLTFAAQPSDKLFIGASLTTHNLDYNQLVFAEELNSDDTNNTFDVSRRDELFTTGTGVSLGLGLIAKLSQEVRLGVSIESPTWYQLTEEFTTFDDVLFFNDVPDIQRNISNVNIFDYNIVTPARFTGSFAYLFGKEGLISFDYTYKDFKTLQLKPSSEFNDLNQDIDNSLKGTSQFKIGAEWRIDNISLRGGYLYEESPYQDALDTDNISGYSLGVGFKFKGDLRLDFSYQNSQNTSFSGLLGDLRSDTLDLDTTNDKFTATFTIGL